MIVDLHAHYPIHLLEQQRRTRARLLALGGRRLPDRLRALVMRVANRLFNYPDGDPVVTIPGLRQGDVGIALSVLLCPFAEIDFRKSYGAPPEDSYFEELLGQLEQVEADVRRHAPHAAVAHNRAELEGIVAQGMVALIHCVEGGVHFGGDRATILRNVDRAGDAGVAYVTVAHLFWRRVATNAPAIPFLPDRLYRLLFPQPDEGLSPLGRVLVEAMVARGILVDVTHMSPRSLDDTFALLDRLDPSGQVPVIATHAACRLGKLGYNLTDDHIRAIHRRGGVVGLMACRHYLQDGAGLRPRSFEDSIAVLSRHIDRLYEVTGGHDTAALGSDFDGFIKPTLPGVEGPLAWPAVRAALYLRYRPADVRKICCDNARRVLEHWRGSPTRPSPALGMNRITTTGLQNGSAAP